MIVYLGMPRCASSWLYDHVQHVETEPTRTKETHYLYHTPTNLDQYCTSRVLDFSTNNWSMDSNVARAIDPHVSNYIFITRDPIELAISYRSLIKSNQSLNDFINGMIIGKLLCFGDIIERWYNLVDPDKIILYTYNDIVENPNKFLSNIVQNLNIPMPPHIDTSPSNVSTTKKVEEVSSEHKHILNYQVAKFEQLTGCRIHRTTL